MNSEPFIPTRLEIKKIGVPCEKYNIIEMMINKGDNKNIENIENNISIILIKR